MDEIKCPDKPPRDPQVHYNITNHIGKDVYKCEDSQNYWQQAKDLF